MQPFDGEVYERRLPVYLLLDCSESMVGEGIAAVNQGMRQLLLDLHSDPHALETVWMSIITFADTAQQIVPLSELSDIKAPKLKVRPGSGLGEALRLLKDCIAREVRTHSATFKGDWKPLVFLLTDGEPTDDWESAADAVKTSAGGGKAINLIAIGCGEAADPLVLMRLTETVLMMSDKPGDFRSLFQWISSSLSISSQAVNGPSAGGAITLAKMPPGLLTQPQAKANRRSTMPTQLFIALRCSRSRKPYLTRYRLSQDDQYDAVCNHVIDEDYFEGQIPDAPLAALGVSSQKVHGIVPCPYCQNPGAGKCPCGQIFCCPPGDDPVQCPKCGSILGFGGGSGEFSLTGRAG